MNDRASQHAVMVPSSLSDDARFRLLADHAPVMLWMSGLDGLCDFFTSTWLEFTGRTLAEERGNLSYAA